MNVHWGRVCAVAGKEWAEMRQTRAITWMMALLPILLVAMILGTDYFILRAAAMGQDMDEDEMPVPEELAHLPRVEAFVIQMNEQYMFYLLLIPVMLPAYIAAHSIIGEKETGTLEPLLATPVSTWELLLGKSIAAIAPAVLLNWLSFAVMVAAMWFLVTQAVWAYAVRGVWIVGMLLHSPLLALLSVLSGVIASSRTNDPRAAQQIAGIFVVPLIAASLVVLMGVVVLRLPLMLYAALVTGFLDLAVLYLAVRIFQRETILTRWR
ncbi:MAG: ABC transporter permease subunit [Anaerolineae bacterium]|nr:ABC transporter permease subunit [Anaerolineae bacterium]